MSIVTAAIKTAAPLLGSSRRGRPALLWKGQRMMSDSEDQPAAAILGAAIRGAPSKISRATAPGRVLAIVCVGVVLANLDLFIVNVALPNIAQEFSGATLGGLSWILNGSAIVYAALLVFFGPLEEGYRRNASFLLGVALFTTASAAAAWR